MMNNFSNFSFDPNIPNMNMMNNQFMNPQQNGFINDLVNQIKKLNSENSQLKNENLSLKSQLYQPHQQNNIINPLMMPMIDPLMIQQQMLQQNILIQNLTNENQILKAQLNQKNSQNFNQNEKNENLVIAFIDENGEFIMNNQCQSNDIMKDLINKYQSKIGKPKEELKQYSFLVQKEVNMNLTVGQNGLNLNNCLIIASKKPNVNKIQNNDIIINDNIYNNNNLKVNNEMNPMNNTNDNNMNNIQIREIGGGNNYFNLIFKETSGKAMTISCDAGMTFKDAVNKYMIKSGIIGNKENLIMMYNANKLSINEQKKLKDIFYLDVQPTISVVDMSGMKGA